MPWSPVQQRRRWSRSSGPGVLSITSFSLAALSSTRPSPVSSTARRARASRCRRPVARIASTAAERSERSEEHTSELQSPYERVCRVVLEKTEAEAFGDALNKMQNKLEFGLKVLW